MTIEVWALGDNLIEIGDDTNFENGVRILLRCGSIRFGRRCRIRDGIWIKSDGDLIAGDKVTLGRHGAVHCSESIEIEDFVGIW